MNTVTIYTRPFCGFCSRAMQLLREKGAPIEEIDAGMDPEKRAEMRDKSGGRNTFPQVFINGEHVGGCCFSGECAYRGTRASLAAAVYTRIETAGRVPRKPRRRERAEVKVEESSGEGGSGGPCQVSASGRESNM